MTTESNSEKSEPPEKLLIDNMSDFQFHAAYIAYSESFDKASDPGIMKRLNDNIEALRENKMDYPTFYSNISEFREAEHSRSRHSSIRTQRKREWRRKAQKRERNKRHRK
jgi:hypothetical protein